MLNCLCHFTNVHGGSRDQAGERFVLAGAKDCTACVLAGVGLRGRVGKATGAALVVDDALDVVGVGCRGTSVLVVETEPVVSNSLVSSDDDLITLANIDR